MGKDSTVVTVISDAPEGPNNPREACLVVINGVDLGKKFSLAQDSTMIGRSSKVDIQVDEDSISRNHAVIENRDDSYVLQDLESTNGTFVNDRPVTEETLRDGDQIKIGSTIFKFLSGSNIESAYHDEIYQLTTTDGLTGAYNKRHFLKEMEGEMSRSIRYDRDLSLVMLDLDRFKETNDTYGHLAGDYILKRVAQLVTSRIRRDDLFARYGGEEFMLLLPEVKKPQAMEVAESLRKIVDREQFKFDGVEIPVTLSAGVADLEEYLRNESYSSQEEISQEFDCFDFIKLVDDRLYQAKNNGRNAVCG
jgi:diguanylate cyclase (GGDEF)-like protein